jgi:hypothetical protein
MTYTVTVGSHAVVCDTVDDVLALLTGLATQDTFTPPAPVAWAELPTDVQPTTAQTRARKTQEPQEAEASSEGLNTVTQRLKINPVSRSAKGGTLSAAAAAWYIENAKSAQHRAMSQSDMRTYLKNNPRVRSWILNRMQSEGLLVP